MTAQDYDKVGLLLKRAGFGHDAKEFKRIASARTLYHWNADSNQEY